MPAHHGSFVAYYRVSTDRQGRSGLGLAAQHEAVKQRLNGGPWKLVGEFTEVESGKRAKRPQLIAALAAAKMQKRSSSSPNWIGCPETRASCSRCSTAASRFCSATYRR